jgi:hypothetical protein
VHSHVGGRRSGVEAAAAELLADAAAGRGAKVAKNLNGYAASLRGGSDIADHVVRLLQVVETACAFAATERSQTLYTHWLDPINRQISGPPDHTDPRIET